MAEKAQEQQHEVVEQAAPTALDDVRGQQIPSYRHVLICCV